MRSAGCGGGQGCCGAYRQRARGQPLRSQCGADLAQSFGRGKARRHHRSSAIAPGLGTDFAARLPAVDEGEEIRPGDVQRLTRGARRADPDRLFGHQGRDDRHGANLGAGTGAAWHYRQCGGAGADPDRQFLGHHPRKAATARRISPTGSRSGGWDLSTMSATRSCSSAIRRAALSPGRRSMSAAAPASAWSTCSGFRSAMPETQIAPGGARSLGQ